jgi:putative membrane protein
MDHSYWGGWGWFLWFGVWFLLISNFGHWGYTYKSHRRNSGQPKKEPLDILNERYALGEIDREEYARMKVEIAPPNDKLGAH